MVLLLKMVDKWLTCRKNNINMHFSFLVFTIFGFHLSHSEVIESKVADSKYEHLNPTVLVATPVRNKEHLLPWFFGQLENLNYPKQRMAIWIHSDHNSDDSIKLIQQWVNSTEHLYNSVEFSFSEKYEAYPEEKGPCDWTDARFDHVIRLREEALRKARLLWADYLFMLDADVMLVNPDILKILVDQKKPIIAPMMNASVGETYSNFWGGMNEEGYYKRVPEYFQIVEREKLGVFKVPMVHTAILIDMQHEMSEKLSYLPPEGYDKPKDDIILFAQSAARVGMSMHVINTKFFGYVMVPLDDYHVLETVKEQFYYLYMEALDLANPDMGPGVDYIIQNRGLIKTPHINTSLIRKDKLGFDQVYMINLDRRPERRKRMLHVFDVLGINAIRTPAVDGKLLNDTYLYKELNIQVVPGFSDPYGGRPMTMGEIGCFLSHYFIWKDVVEKNYQTAVVFEDDLRFEPYFRAKLTNIMNIVTVLRPNWDLIYLGRKRLSIKDESYMQGTKQLVWPSYSYWTLSYLISLKGARKLLSQKPLQNLLPVDEYLPVMFDRHPENSWKEPFHPRDLIALSAEPLLIYPTHYLGEPNYISDTEYSELISDKGTKGTQYSSPGEPQGPPVTDLPGSKSALSGNGLDPDSSYHQNEIYNKDEL